MAKQDTAKGDSLGAAGSRVGRLIAPRNTLSLRNCPFFRFRSVLAGWRAPSRSYKFQPRKLASAADARHTGLPSHFYDLAKARDSSPLSALRFIFPGVRFSKTALLFYKSYVDLAKGIVQGSA